MTFSNSLMKVADPGLMTLVGIVLGSGHSQGRGYSENDKVGHLVKQKGKLLSIFCISCMTFLSGWVTGRVHLDRDGAVRESSVGKAEGVGAERGWTKGWLLVEESELEQGLREHTGLSRMPSVAECGGEKGNLAGHM